MPGSIVTASKLLTGLRRTLADVSLDLWARRIYIGYFIAFLLLASVAILGYRSIDRLAREFAVREQAQDRLDSLESVLRMLMDVETGQRGFLLTGDEQFLEPYYAVHWQLRPRLEDLNEVAAAGDIDARQLAEFKTLALEKIEFAEQTIALLRHKKPQQAIDMIKTGRGRQIMGRLRVLNDSMQRSLNDSLDRRELGLRQSARQTVAIGATSSVIALLLITSGTVVSRRDARKRQQDQAVLARFRGALEAVDDVIFLVDRATMKIIDFNEAAVRRLGYMRDELIGMTPYDIDTGAAPGAIEAGYDRIIASMPRASVHREICRRRDGIEYPVEAQRQAITVDGRLIIVAVLRDISERERIEQQLQQNNERMELSLRAVQRVNREVSLLSRLSSVLQACNSVGETLHPVATYCAQIFPDTAGAMYLLNNSQTLVEEASAWGNRLSVDAQFVPEDCWALRRGQAYRVADPRRDVACRHTAQAVDGGRPSLCVPMVAQNDTLGLLYLEAAGNSDASYLLQDDLASSVVEQISMAIANLRLRDLLRQQSIRDPLTGLYNRRFMEDILNRETARAQRKPAPLSVIALDIDHFKRFNDTFGHDAGDQVLKELARFLQGGVRSVDAVCRLGGEEFLIVMPETDLGTAAGRARQLVATAHAMEIRSGDRALGSITLSMGVAVYPDHAPTPDLLLKVADAALYRAKRSGRDRVEVAGA